MNEDRWMVAQLIIGSDWLADRHLFLHVVFQIVAFSDGAAPSFRAHAMGPDESCTVQSAADCFLHAHRLLFTHVLHVVTVVGDPLVVHHVWRTDAKNGCLKGEHLGGHFASLALGMSSTSAELVSDSSHFDTVRRIRRALLVSGTVTELKIERLEGI